ncbi:putative uncharacterized protein TRPC5OS [Hippopotamus amphibius kiboko]|uniref:putative uncharacterized protein TRPC5OS n=1 Tax=Hippopotamus amphibius kiboko TaxID=575201 RepID=UPI00259995FD|nr:putative uncharacterized protein TRPC5OS [Hippopotamus amphibius kiboko]
MEPVSIPMVVGRLADGIAQLTGIAKELLQVISQELVPHKEQDDGAEQIETGAASPPSEDSLPDLADLSDLESILTPREDEDLNFDIDQAMLDISELHEDILSNINDELRSG